MTKICEAFVFLLQSCNVTVVSNVFSLFCDISILDFIAS